MLLQVFDGLDTVRRATNGTRPPLQGLPPSLPSPTAQRCLFLLSASCCVFLCPSNCPESHSSCLSAAALPSVHRRPLKPLVWAGKQWGDFSCGAAEGAGKRWAGWVLSSPPPHLSPAQQGFGPSQTFFCLFFDYLFMISVFGRLVGPHGLMAGLSTEAVEEFIRLSDLDHDDR